MKGDYFCDLLDFAMPWTGGYAVLLNVYIDASERDGGIFCVGGFAFGASRAKKAERRWKGLWGDTICHMTDLHVRPAGSNFESWSGTKAGEYLKKSVSIINRHRSYGVAVSCDLDEIKALAPTTASDDSQQYLTGFRRAYAICCHLVMSSFGRLVRENGGGDEGIAYFFESGDLHQAEARQFMELGASEPMIKRYWGHGSHVIIDKGNARLLEASDIFAWEWAKHRERLRQRMPKRPSLKALLGDGIEDDEKGFSSPIIRATHLHGAPLRRYFENVKSMILAPDDVALPLLREYLAKRGITLQ